MPAQSREYDVVLLGATGFTGQLVAEYLAASAPADLRWAIAGRSRPKLETVRAGLTSPHPDAVPVGLVEADATDLASVSSLARRTRVVATTVGPFMEYGDGLVAACADNGTHYADITGEPEFVDRMWLRHHDRATETGAKLVHCCGFDSVPHDLGAWWTLQHLPADEPIAMRGYVSARGSISAGTYHSAIRAFGRARQLRRAAAERRARETRPAGRRVGSTPVQPHREPVSGRWTVPLPTIDPIVVRRSAQACEEYGPDFRYGHFAVVGTARAAAAAVTGAAGLMALSQLPPARAALLRLKTSGEGPKAERRERSWFRVRFVATAAEQTVVTQVSGGDPGYAETAKMLGESAMCLALDDLSPESGQLTTVQAMAPALLGRLRRTGIDFQVFDPQTA